MRTVRHSLPGFCMALLAVVLQLVLSQPVTAAPMLAGASGHICGTAPSADQHQAPHHTPADCLCCPLCIGLAASPALAAAPPDLPPAPRFVRLQCARAVPGREPYRATFHAFAPRGPPVLT